MGGAPYLRPGHGGSVLIIRGALTFATVLMPAMKCFYWQLGGAQNKHSYKCTGPLMRDYSFSVGSCAELGAVARRSSFVVFTARPALRQLAPTFHDLTPFGTFGF